MLHRVPLYGRSFVSNGPGSHLIEYEEVEDTGEGNEDQLEQVGPKNKMSVTQQVDFVQMPNTGIFGGHMMFLVYQQSSKESATLQPFFTLQLEIQFHKIRTVQDALESLVARESVQGYTTKTKQEVEVSCRVTLEKLPPVLVFYLQRFVYEKTGRCQKLVKNIDYPVDLEISRELLSSVVKNKKFKCHRTGCSQCSTIMATALRAATTLRMSSRLGLMAGCELMTKRSRLLTSTRW